MEYYPQRILLIDNNEDDYNLICDLLGQLHEGSCELHWLSTYETAAKALVEGQYDLYLIDSHLGPKTGLELLNEVAAKSCQAPIILLTEQHNRDTGPEALKLGAMDYLVKSQLEANLLERSIRYAVARKQTELERYRLLTAEEEQHKLAKALHDIAIALNSTLKLDELLERILTNIGRVVPHDTADIMLRENDRVRIVSSRGYVEQNQTLVQGMSFSLTDFPSLRQMTENGQPLAITDTKVSAKWIDIPETRWVRSYAGAPIRQKDDVVGFLNLASATPNFFSPTHAERLLTFADQAGIALGKAQLLRVEREQRALAEALREVSIVLNAILDFDTILDRLLDQIGRVVPYDSGSVLLVGGGRVHVARMHGYEQFGPDTVRAINSVSFDIAATNSFRQIVKTKQPLVIFDTASDPDWVPVEKLEHIRSWVGAPILVQGDVFALFSLDKVEPNFYQRDHADLLALFASQVTPALENAWLFEAEARRRREAENLAKATTALTSAHHLDQVIENILLHLAQVIPYDSTCLFLLEKDKLRAVAVRGHPTPEQVIGCSYPVTEDVLFEEMQRTQQPIHIFDAQADPRFLNWGETTYVRGWLGVPLIVRGEVIGQLTLDSRQAGMYGEAHATLAQAFANQAATAIENARLIQTAREARQLSDTLREIGASLTATLKLDEVLNRILDGLGKVVPLISASVWLIENDMLFIKAGQGIPADNPVWQKSFAISEKKPPLGFALIEHRRSLIVPDVQQDPRWIKLEANEQIRGWLGVPLLARNQAIGFLGIDHSQPNFYTEEHAAVANTFAQQAVIAIENARLYEQVAQHASELQERVTERTFELQVMFELAQALGQATQLGDVVRLILLHLYQAIPYDVAACLLATNSTRQLFIQSQHPFSRNLESTIEDIALSVLKGLGNQTCDKLPQKVSRIQPKGEIATRPPLDSLNSLMQVPIIVKGDSVGLLLLGSEAAEQFGADQARLLRTIADQAAESIERLQLLVAAEYQRLESLVAHLPNGVVLLDAEQHIVLANPMGQEFLKRTGDATIGNKLSYLGKEAVEAILAQDSLGVPSEIVAAGSPDRLLEVTATPMAVGPEAGGWLLVIRDITEERATQKRVQQQEQMAAVGQLAAGIAHDFNNILTGIIGYTELLQADPQIPDSAQQDLERITNQGHRAARLVRQILDFSRQSITEKRPLDLAPLLKEVITLLERTIPENILISLEIEPPREYLLNADLSQMQQVLTNLAVNARDAMPSGGRLEFRLSRLTLSPDARPPQPDLKPGNWIVLTISDTGIGIPAKYQPHIFEPFFTTKETGKGTGLGLAQVYGIITEHNGFVDVVSQTNKGTTFSLYFPALPPLSGTSERAIPIETPHGDGEVILLVEDAPSVLKATKTMLEYLGYQVLTASNGRSALQTYEQHQSKIGLVLTDITMPDMDGLALSQTLHKRNPALKVVAITGYPLDTTREANEWRAQGIVDWLHKPLTLERLGSTLYRLLKNEEEIS